MVKIDWKWLEINVIGVKNTLGTKTAILAIFSYFVPCFFIEFRELMRDT